MQPVRQCAAGRRCSTSLCSGVTWRSEEHTSELQSRSDLVCRLLLEKKKNHHERQMKDLRLYGSFRRHGQMLGLLVDAGLAPPGKQPRLLGQVPNRPRPAAVGVWNANQPP